MVEVVMINRVWQAWQGMPPHCAMCYGVRPIFR